MKISMIKTFAWNNYEKGDDSIGFNFKGKRITYPWLDPEKQAFELTTVQAIDAYGLKNIKAFCEEIINICPCRIQTFSEWLGGDTTNATEGQIKAYQRWCEPEVEYEFGKLTGMEG